MAFWLTTGLLSGALILALGWGFLQMARGRLSLDLGWGRSRHSLGPIVIRVRAPRELVFEALSAPYVGRSPAGSRVEVIERGDGLVIAEHHTPVHFYTARTLEAVALDPPSRITFRHLAGPVPEAFEAFELREEDGETVVEYRGEVGLDFWWLGRIAARFWVVPQWESKVRPHLEGIVAPIEERAARRRAREEREATD